MSALHLGVATAVLRDDKILLSKRGDFGVWNLPTGRLDAGEAITAAAAREVQEESGITCQVARAVGLYYQTGRSRLNILFSATHTGGTLQQRTDESTQNAYFPLAALPSPFFGDYMAQHAASGSNYLHVLNTPPPVLRQIRRQLAWRWVRNLLAGKPEPRWEKFEVQASLALMDRSMLTVLSVPSVLDTSKRILPGIIVNGSSAPWEQLRTYVRDQTSAYELRTAELRWVGLYHHVARQVLELIFATDIMPTSPISGTEIEWLVPGSGRWWQGYRPYMQALQHASPNVVIVTE